MTDERGATEVLGYVLIIALITSVVAVVMTMGVGGLHASQEAEQINNMERAFDVLSHNIEEATHRGSPSRATELRLTGGSVTYGDEVEINVTVDDEPIENVTIETDPIIYDNGGDTQIVYEAGAVIRTDGDRSIMLQPPAFVMEEDYVLIQGIRTRALSGSAETLDQDGTVLLRKEYLGSSVGTTTFDTDTVVNITVVSPRADAWERYLAGQEVGEIVEVDDQRVVYQLKLEDEVSISVVRSRIRVTFAE